MKVSIGIGGAASNARRDFAEHVAFVVEAEKLGVDTAWSAEAWGQDAVTPLAFLAARTERIRLGTGIMQISARVPSMTAMTALSLAAISGDRFLLGLGVSGPQVVEGLHGRPFKAPLSRLRETVDIVKMAFIGERLAYFGRYHQLPLPDGEGKALRLAQGGNQNIPIYLATLGPKALVYTGAEADGWLGTSFVPSAADAHLAHIRKGAEAAGRDLRDIDIQVGGTVAFGDAEELAQPLKASLAFTLGAMGSATTNFYNEAYQRAGWETVAREAQALWVAGRRDAAIEAIPTELVLASNLLGTEAEVSARLNAYRDAGVNTIRLAPAGADLTERLDTLGRAMDLLKSAS